jgi:hypothetical protein
MSDTTPTIQDQATEYFAQVLRETADHLTQAGETLRTAGRPRLPGAFAPRLGDSCKFSVVWQDLACAGVPVIECQTFWTDEGTLGTGMGPAAPYGANWSDTRRIDRLAHATRYMLSDLSNQLWSEHFAGCFGQYDGNSTAVWHLEDGDGSIEISYLDDDGNAPLGGGVVLLDRNGKIISRKE